MDGSKTEQGAAARMFVNHPERLATAWRRERYNAFGGGGVPENLLDGLVEDFIQQIGRVLDGAEGSAWSRTRGLLRLSLARGPKGLYDEFGTLRRCLLDALSVIDAPAEDLAAVAHCLHEAAESAVAYHRRLLHPDLPDPAIPFGGLVVELVEPRRKPRLITSERPADDSRWI